MTFISSLQAIHQIRLTLVKVATTGELQQNGGKEVNVNGARIALFHSNGHYYALEALCRHQDKPIAPGKLDGLIVGDIFAQSFPRFARHQHHQLRFGHLGQIRKFVIRVVVNQEGLIFFRVGEKLHDAVPLRTGVRAEDPD